MTTPATDLAITAWLDALLSELLPADSRPPETESRHQSAIAAELRRQRALRLRAAGFPIRALQEARAPHLRAPGIVALAAWSPERRNLAVLSGPVGCGKTVAATWWALTQTHRDVGYVRATTLAATGLDDDATHDLLGRDALVLDDLGIEDEDGRVVADVDELVDTFHGSGRPLVITTALSATEIATRYGSRVADRIVQAGHWQSLSGPSLRA
jgi:DNA replication protein DnaC